MRIVTTLAVLAALAVPGWKAYSLNASVAHLRDAPQAVPFFAYYRYGVMSDSVVFNVNTTSCAEVLDNVIPSFRRFVATVQTTTPREIRLAWQGETVAVVQSASLQTDWHQTAWDERIALDSLQRAVRCSSNGNLFIDWKSLARPDTALT